MKWYKSGFYKYGPIPSSFSFIFVLFPLQFQQTKIEKSADDVLGIKTQHRNMVGSRQNHGAMTATSSIVFGPTPASFSFIFGLFKQTIQFLQQINVKKCHVHPVYGAGIRTHDLSSPITTRPGLPPPKCLYLTLISDV